MKISSSSRTKTPKTEKKNQPTRMLPTELNKQIK